VLFTPWKVFRFHTIATLLQEVICFEILLA
jgi:hypothetical protein